MKATKICVLLAIVAVICSCEKDFTTDVNVQTPAQTRAELNETPTMLFFSSIEEMESQINELCQMQPEELNMWYATHSFVSQYEALYKAAEEIDMATSLSEAEAIKAKYSAYFLYNNNPEDEELFNPYLPNENTRYAYVCNINGEVVINGEIVNFNTIKNVEDTKEYRITHNPIAIKAEEEEPNVTKPNYLKRTVDKHKFWAEGGLDSNEVVTIEYTAHKKGLFGWNKCKMSYFFRISRTDFGWESYSPEILYYFDSGENGLWTAEFPSHTVRPFGRLKYHQTANAWIYIYSKGTGEAGAGTLQLTKTSTRATN